MDDERLQKAIEIAKEATLKDRCKDYEAAFELYKQSLEHWFIVVKYQSNPVLKRKLQEKMDEYTTRAESLKEYLANRPIGNGSSGNVSDGVAEGRKTDENKTDSESQEKEKLKSGMEGVIVATKPDVRWDQVAGLEAAKSALREAVVLPIKFPQLFSGQCKPWKGILLYGPPGTGKTYLAKACATETDSTFLSASSADLVSKWQGESEKLIRALFETARDRRPSVIFIDEIDSIGGGRNDSESDSTRRLKTEFLIQMDGIGNDAKDILILAATNTPWDLDPAIRRRFERRIHIPLPDLAARVRLIEVSIGDSRHSLTQSDIQLLAERLEGFSGSDVGITVRDALLQGIRKLSTATHFKRVMGSEGQQLKWIPCSPDDRDRSKAEMGLLSMNPVELESPQLTMEDFAQAIVSARPSVAKEDLARYQEWTNKFGLEGGS